MQNHLHFSRAHAHYIARYELKHSGDYRFIHDKISARQTFHRETLELILLFGAAFVFLVWGAHALSGWPVGVILVGMATAFYISTILFKFLVFLLAFGKGIPDPKPIDLNMMDNRELPRYTILVPTYKEGKSIRSILNALNNLDYPRGKLDIKLLLEEGDKETVKAVESYDDLMGPEYSVLILPQGLPRTKPRALNAGLMEARGEFLTIYDAEDVPAYNQLKKAVWVFRHSGDDMVALQCKLNFYNPHENILSCWFAAEYTTWFDFVLPGLHMLNMPIPLGGTSNHFKTHMLRELGGWDPYNVTEDADLGLRISRSGGRISMIESTTWGESSASRTSGNRYGVGMMDSFTLEESNTDLNNWIGQRSRWVKGFIQTFLVHSRHPGQTVREYSVRGLFTLFFLIIGTPLTHLLNLIFWMMAILWILTNSSIISALYPEPLLTLGWASFIIGNAFFIAMHVLAPLRKGDTRTAFWALFIPIYWLLMAMATLKAVYQIFFRPHYWEKTAHGLKKA